MDKDTLYKIECIVGKENLTTVKEDLLCYSYDGTGREYPPAAVAFPGNTEEVAAIMQLANEKSFPVVPRGAGTGMTGGSLPVFGGLVLAMNNFNKILEIDTDNQIAVVEPGVITGAFQEEVKKKGLFYPPDPASYKFCTLGGNAAECAGGPSAVKYGVTRDYILGLEVVLPDGRIMNTGTRTAKGVAGYDLTRLFVGSEGTLGIITKIIVKLLALPEAKNSFLVLFDDLYAAAALVSKIMARHLPCTLEFMDKTSIDIVSSHLKKSLADNTRALLLVEIDGPAESVAMESGKLKQFLQGEKSILSITHAKTKEEIDSVWTARRALSPASFSIRPHKINEDVVVPRAKIPQLVTYIEKLSADLSIPIFCFGHAGDGNIHVNIMIDKENLEEAEKGQRAKKLLFKEVLALSGTISGEHGVGITKADFLAMDVGNTAVNVMQGLKRFFDPNNVLNPGKIFPAG